MYYYKYFSKFKQFYNKSFIFICKNIFYKILYIIIIILCKIFIF